MLRGHVTMAAGLAGDQWYEGDVSCSVVRRVVLPDAFLTIDGLLETTLEVVRELGVYPAVIDEELRRYLPFLSTTRLLIAAVQRGVGRETAHELIRRARGGGGAPAARGGQRGRRPARPARRRRSVPHGRGRAPRRWSRGRPVPVGRAGDQVAAYVARVEKLAAAHPDAAAYHGGSVL